MFRTVKDVSHGKPQRCRSSAPARPASRGRLSRILILVLVGGCSLAGGMFAPRFFGGTSTHSPEKSSSDAKQALVPFGEVVVNLSEERLTRYLRVKLMLLIDGNHEKEDTEKINKSKAMLKSWLIGHLTDKTLKEVQGGAGVNRIRREIHEQFNALLGGEKDMIQDVLFEEFVIQ